MNRIKTWTLGVGRKIMQRVIVPLARPVVWHIVYFDLIRRPSILRYIRTRTELLDRYDEIFPGAKECLTREEVLEESIKAVREAGLGGLWCEFGVWNGESINRISRLTSGKVYGFDSFEGLPVDWSHSLTRDMLLPKDYFKRYSLPRVHPNVELVKGWFHETLPPFLEEHPEGAAFIHIDSDVYESAKVVLDLLKERITKGTVILFDEYFNYPSWESHEYLAFKEFLAERKLRCRWLAFNSSGEQAAVQIV